MDEPSGWRTERERATFPAMLEMPRPPWLRRLAGAAWLAGWSGLIWMVHRPWSGLGGLVSERLRWLERFVLAAGLIVGHTVGEIARSRTKTHRARTARWLFYPAAVVTAVASAALRIAGRHDVVGIVLTGFVTGMAGLWSAYLGVGAACRDESDSGPALPWGGPAPVRRRSGRDLPVRHGDGRERGPTRARPPARPV